VRGTSTALSKRLRPGSYGPRGKRHEIPGVDERVVANSWNPRVFVDLDFDVRGEHTDIGEDADTINPVGTGWEHRSMTE